MSDNILSPQALPFLRHIERCNQARLPGERTPLFYRGRQIGWIAPEIAPALTLKGFRTGTSFTLPDASILESLGHELALLGLYASHNELFDVRDDEDNVIGQIDRGAIPLFGLPAEGIHLNGLVNTPDGLKIWIARRSASKRLDPCKLDHIVAGGMSAGLTATETLIKEAHEEAGIPEAIAQKSVPVARIQYALERAEGLRRDILHCFDLYLPNNFVPVAEDGEVESFHLESLSDIFCRVRDTNDFKFNVNLVLIDLFIRQNFFSVTDSIILAKALRGHRS
ncbi:NUDIX hydrolase [Gluconobacter wancherniae]|uniref:NUDIX hydrolase n=1 Tax=Gluconobacter wancherniae TaxID=1307955 RepID=UPI0031FEAD1B